MAPGRAVVMIVLVVMTVIMSMAMAMIRMVMVVVAMIMMMIMMRMVVAIVTVAVIVFVIVRRCDRGADRVQGPIYVPRFAKKALALDPDQPRANERDQRVAGKLDHPLGAAHLPGGGVEQRRRDTDDRDRDEGLQQRRRKRQHDAAPPGLFVGDEIRRDHRLAMAGAGGVKDAIGKGDAEQGPYRAAVGLGGADNARHVAVELGLLGEHPADDAVGGRRRRGARRAERGTLREDDVEGARREQERGHGRKQHERDRGALSGSPGQGHLTEILLENAAP